MISYMRLFKTFIVLAALLMASSARAQIVYADYSDPDVCCGTEGDYWMTASSFQCVPGLPILHSTDLQHWTLENYAVEALLPEEHYRTVQHGNGVWAPSIRLHDGTYYIYWGDPDFGIFMVKTDDPRKQWSKPVLVVEGKGLIDTCPLWDEDGRVWLVNGWANSRCGFNSVLTVRELSADGTKAIGTPRMVYDGLAEGNFTIEGPKFYKVNGYYYILAPAGGVETGWQLAMRSKNVFGPYESKIVFNQEGIHQGGWVWSDSKAGTGSFICFQERAAYGRILHLLDVKMEDGWPMMKKAAADKKPATAVTMAEGLYGKGFSWHANYQEWFGFEKMDGAHRVYGYEYQHPTMNMWNVPNLWLCRFDGESFTRTMRMKITAKTDEQESGFIVMGRDYCRLAAVYENDHFVLKQIVCKDADKNGKEESKQFATIPARDYNMGVKTNHECEVWFRMSIKRQPTAQSQYNAVCTFAYSTDGKRFLPVPDTFTPREGKWIGAKYGAFSITKSKGNRGWCDVY